MTIKIILNNLFDSFKSHYKELIFATLAVLIVTSFPSDSISDKSLSSRIVFNKKLAFPLGITKAQTNVVVGTSQNDMNQLNQNPNPEAIKNFMCAIAPDYGVDWKLVYAIGYHESGNYQSALAKRNNNYFGRKARTGSYAAWSTPEEGIRNQFEYIKNNYYNRGLTTPSAINPIYAEDSSWQHAVNSIMNTL